MLDGGDQVEQHNSDRKWLIRRNPLPELIEAGEQARLFALPESLKMRQAAARVEEEYRLTAARLRNSGALVVRARASTFSAEAVNEYLRVKAHGLL